MAYSIAVNAAVSVLHVCRDLSGNPVTGQAANLTTALRDPTFTTSGASITVTEIGSTGAYTVTFTPTSTGVWLLSVTNPVAVDGGQVFDYPVDCKTATAIQADSTRYLTTLARVKERLQSTIAAGSSAFDNLLTTLISEVSGHAHNELDFYLVPEQVYTHDVDGLSTEYLNLPQGPLVSITSINAVARSGSGETLTLVDSYRYAPALSRANGGKTKGKVRLLDGTVWTWGRANYRVVYTAGFDTIPEAVAQAATKAVVAEFLVRELQGLQSRVSGDGSTQLISSHPAVMRSEFLAALGPYRVPVVG